MDNPKTIPLYRAYMLNYLGYEALDPTLDRQDLIELARVYNSLGKFNLSEGEIFSCANWVVNHRGNFRNSPKPSFETHSASDSTLRLNKSTNINAPKNS